MDGALVGIVVGVIVAITSVAGVIVAWHGGRRAEKNATEQQQLATEQQQLATYSTAANWLHDLREWAFEAVDILAEASYLCKYVDRLEEDGEQQLHFCRHRMSALIDRGRFFLPNQNTDEYGQEKLPAYRGYRHAVLDPLLAAVRILEGKASPGKFLTRESALIEMRKIFVSGVQRILAPDSNNRKITSMISEADEQRASDPTFGGLLPDKKEIPSGADDLLS